MQIFKEIEQGSAEWFAARMGIPTASCFDKILTPTGKLSAQADAYANQLLAEMMLGYSIETWAGNQWTERGKEVEADAVLFYEMQKDMETEKVGFVKNHNVGCSPDRLVGDEGLLEIKCPAPHTHIGYLLKDALEPSYIPQIQGQLYVTDRKWCDWMSYHPELPSLIIRVERDEQYIAALSESLTGFLKMFEDKVARMIQLGHIKL